MAENQAKSCRVKLEIIYDNGDKLKCEFPGLDPNIGAELIAYLRERRLEETD